MSKPFDLQRVTDAAYRAFARTVQTDTGFESPCWIWQGGTAGDDRPCMRVDGQTQYVARVVLAARLGRELGWRLLATHRCDQERCIHPDHLEEGTYSKNLFEAYERGLRPAMTNPYHSKQPRRLAVRL